jgi:hypothetical protein
VLALSGRSRGDPVAHRVPDAQLRQRRIAPFGARTWNGSPVVEHQRAAGLANPLVSTHALPVGAAIHAIALMRAPGEPQFTSGQARLLHLFHEEPGRLWHAQARVDPMRFPRGRGGRWTPCATA